MGKGIDLSNNDSFKDVCLDRLKRQGNRVTQTRIQIARHLDLLDTPFSAKEIHEEMCQGGLDFATVYRTLQKLEALDLIHGVGNSGKFVKCNAKHLCEHNRVHVIYRCEACGDISEHQVNNKTANNLFSATTKLNPQFKSTNLVMDLKGYCSNCSNN